MTENWDPREHEKVYYRHVSTGDRAYLVRREGKDVLRMDRGAHEMLRPMNHEWARDEESRPITRHMLGHIAFEADRLLCQALGMHEQARREWANLSDEARIAWMDDGPRNEPRRGLWLAITDVLRPLSK